jgi:hypothetical protein
MPTGPPMSARSDEPAPAAPHADAIRHRLFERASLRHVIAAVAALAATGFVVVMLLATERQRGALWIELGKALLQLLVVGAFGALITVVIDEFRASRETAAEAERIAREKEHRERDDRRADEAQQLERRREDHLIRERLIGQAIDAPSALYLATQHYWRAKKEKLDVAAYRIALDEQYLKSRRQGLVLEYQVPPVFEGRPGQVSRDYRRTCESDRRGRASGSAAAEGRPRERYDADGGVGRSQ